VFRHPDFLITHSLITYWGIIMRIGEIIETGTTGFVAESLELNQPPALGSLVKVEVGDGACVYGVVSHGTTAGLDPGRRAVRRSTEQVYDQAIYDEHPELRRTLRTEFSVLLVGCVEDGAIRQHLPAQLPPLHYLENRLFVEQVANLSYACFHLVR